MVAMFRSIKYELYDMPHVTTLHVIVDDMQQCIKGIQLAIRPHAILDSNFELAISTLGHFEIRCQI